MGKKLKNIFKKLPVYSLVVVFCLSITACEKNNDNDKLVGSPWVNSMIPDNLPETKPEIKDDLYLNVNYDSAVLNQGRDVGAFTTYPTKIRDYFVGFMRGENEISENNTCSQAELDAITLFYNQAKDWTSLKEKGVSELMPYFELIDGAQTIEELNKAILSDEFPFCPMIKASVYSKNMNEKNGVFIDASFIYGSESYDAGQHFADTDDEDIEASNYYYFETFFPYVEKYLSLMGYPEDETADLANSLFYFEKSYGKYLIYESGSYDIGLESNNSENSVEEIAQTSLDELSSLCPNYPLKEILEKFGKDSSEYYVCNNYKWLEELDKLWTQDNLELIKTKIKSAIISECDDLLDPDYFKEIRESQGYWPYDEETFASAACEQTGTFAHLVNKIFVENYYSAEAVQRLYDMTEDIIAAFGEIIDETSWLSDESKEKMQNKLNNITLNVLSPSSGYTDYSDLKLIPSEEGGSLLGNYLIIKKYLNDLDSSRIGNEPKANSIWNDVDNLFIAQCYYMPTENSINILPTYATVYDYSGDESNERLLSTIGETIAHEISHGFDRSGVFYDENGADNMIMTAEDMEKYQEKTSQLADYFSSMEVLDGVYVDGKNVVGEAAADLCAMQTMLRVLRKEDDANYKEFFEIHAMTEFRVSSGMEDFYYNLSDVHPLGYLRINVNAQMFDEFYKTYDVKEGDGMYLAEKDRITLYGN